MFTKNISFNSFLSNSGKYKKNIKIVKKIFNNLKIDHKDLKIPLLDSFEKNYNYDFSRESIKRFLKYKNLIIIGMGGSILGAKSIYSFLKKKIKKNVFFFDNLDHKL